jgi:hypothetical protein
MTAGKLSQLHAHQFNAAANCMHSRFVKLTIGSLYTSYYSFKILMAIVKSRTQLGFAGRPKSYTPTRTHAEV